jgi:hypothetical protein
MLRNRAVILVTMAIAACGKTEDPVPQANTAPAPPPPPVRPSARVFTEAEEVRGAVQILWPQVLDADSADEKWAKCHDQTHGLDDIRSCLKTSRSAVAAVKEKLPKLKVQTDCGKRTEQKLRDYPDTLIGHYDATLAWLDKNENRFRAPLRAKSLFDLDLGGEPARKDMGLLSITNEPCMVRVLACKDTAFCSAPEMDAAAGVAPR